MAQNVLVCPARPQRVPKRRAARSEAATLAIGAKRHVFLRDRSILSRVSLSLGTLTGSAPGRVTCGCRLCGLPVRCKPWGAALAMSPVCCSPESHPNFSAALDASPAARQRTEVEETSYVFEDEV